MRRFQAGICATRMEDGKNNGFPAKSEATAKSAFILFKSGDKANAHCADYRLERNGRN